MERAEYVPVDDVVEDVRARLAEGVDMDYATLGGSGEPTLHRRFGEIATGIKAAGPVPIALLTNGGLFHLPDVRAACADIDLVLPSLDAGDEETFQRVNRPHDGLTLEGLVDGLARLRREHPGRMWVEVFLIDGVNTSDGQVEALGRCIDRIDPHRVQLNTAVRPPAEEGVRPPACDRMEAICELLGPRAEIIAPVRDFTPLPGAAAQQAEVLAMLRRRPCTVKDIADGLGMHPNEAVKCVRVLLDEGSVARRQRLYETYYEAVSPRA